MSGTIAAGETVTVTGITDTTTFAGPGNAVWQFGLYSPNPGQSATATATAQPLILGAISEGISTAGKVTITFSLKGSRIARLVAEGRKEHLTSLRARLTFTSKSGKRTTTIQTLQVKLP